MKTIGYILAVITVTIWSSTFIITKLVLNYMSPIELLTYRMFLATLAMFLMYPKYKSPRSFKEEVWYMLSGFALASYFVFENTALDKTYPSNVGLLVALSPIVTTMLLSIRNKTSYFNVPRTVGLLLALLGVGLVVFGESGFEGFSPLGDVLALGAAVSFSFYTIFLKEMKDEKHIIQRTRKVFLYMFVYILMFALFSGVEFNILHQSTNVILGVVFLAILASSLAFIFWNKAIELLGTFETSVFIYLIPVITMIFSYIVLDDPFTLLKVVGALCIIVGLIFSEKKVQATA